MTAALLLAEPEPATRGYLERQLASDGFHANPRSGAAIREHPEGVLTFELAQVGQQLELVGDLVVPRQSGSHRQR